MTAPAAAYDDFMRDTAPSTRAHRTWTPDDGPLPALYISHGAPPLLEDSLWISELSDWARSMPKPKSILIVSAHWEEAPLSLSAPGAATPLVYDFGGFDRRYFEMTYPTPDAAALATQVESLMTPADNLHSHTRRGLDHGAWVPLKVMYPYADVPVLQLSLPTHAPDRLLTIGRQLKALRAEGVLVIGSGFMTHGLPYLSRSNFTDNVVPSWSRDFDDWASDALTRGDVDTLSDYRRVAPGLPYAHPTVEHFSPLFVALGAAEDPSAPVASTITGYRFGLSKRSFAVA